MRLRLLVTAALLLTGCAAEEESRPTTWTVEVGTAPTLLALTDAQVFAASYGTGVGGSQVYRVDRATGRLAAQRTLAGQPNGMALAPDGEVWLATVQLPDQPSGTGLQVLDPQSLQTRRALLPRGIPLSVAFVGEALWIGDERGVRELDRETGAVRREVATEVPAYRLLPFEERLLVVGPAGVQLVDPGSGTTGRLRLLDAGGSVSVTGDDDHLWVVHPDMRDRSVLARLDSTSLAQLATAPSPGRAGAAAHLVGDRLWVSDPTGGRLLCLDAGTGAVRAVHETLLTGPLVADETSVVTAQSVGLRGVPADCGDD
jgi:hypothetical protein